MYKYANIIKFLAYLSLAVIGHISYAININQQNNFNKKDMSDFQQYAIKVMHDWQVPGMSIAIVQNNQIIYAKGFGVRNTNSDPVTPDTIFDIASLTKSFTAAILAMQVDEDKYGWDTKIKELYPDFKLYDSKTTNQFEIKDLIAHDSGLPADSLDALSNFSYSIDHTLYAMRFIKPVAPFRTQFAYQNIFLEVAKKIIEEKSNKSYTQNLHNNIFSQLNMNNSYVVTDRSFKNSNNVAQPFIYYSGKNYPYSKNNPYLIESWAIDIGLASGGIRSSAMDIAKWLNFNINNGMINNKQLISPKNMNFIHSVHTPIKVASNGEVLQAYGEGWFIDKEEYKPYTVLYHIGGGTGMHALMAYIPEKKVGIVILTNQYTNKVPESLYKSFFDLYLNRKSMQDWSKKYIESRDLGIIKAKSVNKCSTIKSINLDRYTGIYYNPVYGNLILTKQNGHLILKIGPQNIIWKLIPCKNGIFKAYWPNTDKMPVQMIPIGEDIVEFSGSGLNLRMFIPFLNDDNYGSFKRVSK